MTRIASDRPLVTLVNVFRLREPRRQDELVDVLVRATDEVMRHLPGYISANIHKSLDGTHVVNYAQWRSADDWEAMKRNPAAGPHMARAFELAEVEGHLYQVLFTDGGASQHDAGAVELDGCGAKLDDGGTRMDGGASEHDLGVAEFDGGAPQSGASAGARDSGGGEADTQG